MTINEIGRKNREDAIKHSKQFKKTDPPYQIAGDTLIVDGRTFSVQAVKNLPHLHDTLIQQAIDLISHKQPLTDANKSCVRYSIAKTKLTGENNICQELTRILEGGHYE